MVWLLSKRPEDRPASAGEVLQVLEHPASADTSSAEGAEVALLDRIVRGRLIGRGDELAEAQACWQRSAAGEGRVLLVTGEAGIGKTRLVRELITHVKVAGGRVLASACYAEGGPPYARVAGLLHEVEAQIPQALDELPESVLADLLAAAPSLRLRYPNIPPNPLLPPQAEQQRVFESLVVLFQNLAAGAPLCLFIDDADWADNGTLFLIRYLVRRLRDSRLAIVLTCREAELGATCSLRDVTNDLVRERVLTHIRLGHLTRDQTPRAFEDPLCRRHHPGVSGRDLRPDRRQPIFRRGSLQGARGERQGAFRRRALAAPGHGRAGNPAERAGGHPGACRPATRANARGPFARRDPWPRV